MPPGSRKGRRRRFGGVVGLNAGLTYGPYTVEAGQVWAAGGEVGQVFVAGEVATQVFAAGATAGKVIGQ